MRFQMGGGISRGVPDSSFTEYSFMPWFPITVQDVSVAHRVRLTKENEANLQEA